MFENSSCGPHCIRIHPAICTNRSTAILAQTMGDLGDIELLTFPPTMASAGTPKLKRFRLPDSELSVAGAQTALRGWFKEAGSKNINGLLSASADWPARGTPAPAQLCNHSMYTLATSFAGVDHTIHPRHSRLVAAILAEHSSVDESPVVVVSGPRRPEVEAMLLARSILMVLSKYRDLVKYPGKSMQTRRQASIDEWSKIRTLCSKLHLPSGGEQYIGAPDSSAADRSTSTVVPDELDAELALLDADEGATSVGTKSTKRNTVVFVFNTTQKTNETENGFGTHTKSKNSTTRTMKPDETYN